MKAILVVFLGLVSALHAGRGEDPSSYIHAEARWAVVIRVSEYLDSAIAAGLMEKEPGERAELWALRVHRRFGVDPLSEVDTVILYGPDGERENGVAVILGVFAVDGALERLSGKDSYRQYSYQGALIHSWEGGALSYPRPGVAVLGRKNEIVERALDTMEGRGPHVAQEKLAGMAENTGPSGVFLSLFIEEVSSLEGIPPKAAVLQHADRLRLELGETGDRFRGSLQLKIREEEAANHIENILNGLVGYARLGEEQGRPLTFLLRHVRVERNGREVGASFEIPVVDLLEWVGRTGI